MRVQPSQSLPWRCGYCERVVQSNYAHKCSEYDAAFLRAHTNGDAGDAIDYALGHIENPKAQIGFLDDWRDGRDLPTRWPGYARWLVVQRAGAASGIETEGQDGATRLGAKHESPTAESGDAQEQPLEPKD